MTHLRTIPSQTYCILNSLPITSLCINEVDNSTFNLKIDSLGKIEGITEWRNDNQANLRWSYLSKWMIALAEDTEKLLDRFCAELSRLPGKSEQAIPIPNLPTLKLINHKRLELEFLKNDSWNKAILGRYQIQTTKMWMQVIISELRNTHI